ncbi:hypothetical protein GQR58_008853 [Nymphon striatum]|nr:hypothetical protein GQR58_008853 [Nymphon striatum]
MAAAEERTLQQIEQEELEQLSQYPQVNIGHQPSQMPSVNDQKPVEVNHETSVKSTLCVTNEVMQHYVSLPILPVIMVRSSNGCVVKTLALLDSGSTDTFCSESLLYKFGLNIDKIQKQHLTFRTLNSNDEIETRLDTTLAKSTIKSMNPNTGAVIPPNLVPDRFLFYTADNIDIMDETLDEKNTFHATQLAA